MFLMDITEPRVLGLIIGGSIAIVSLVAIFLRFLLRQHCLKQNKMEGEHNDPDTEI
jgi:hypothetical protein